MLDPAIKSLILHRLINNPEGSKTLATALLTISCLKKTLHNSGIERTLELINKYGNQEVVDTAVEGLFLQAEYFKEIEGETGGRNKCS